MKLRTFTFSLFLSILSFSSFAQSESPAIKPSMIGAGTYYGQVGPLRDIPALTFAEIRELDRKDAYKKRNQEMRHRYYPNADNALPKGNDAVWQNEMGAQKSIQDVVENWAGQSSYSNPPDDNGTAGPNHYMQTINVKYTIYDKQGTLLVGPTNLNTLFAGVPGANNNDGDPIIMYDEQADRWLVAEFSGIYNNPDYMLIAVSTTNDPTGTWDRWSFVMNGFPDYMKFGIWRDGYYMGTNTYSGDDIYIFERDVMLAGGSNPQMAQFNNPYRPNSGFHCVLPMDNDGAFAPVGTPGGFITINDDAWGGGADALWVFELDVDWNTIANSTFQRTQVINVSSFDSNFGSTWENIQQPNTGQKLDAINQILMHRAQYRNFNGAQSIVCNHTVDVDASDHAGIRWYELEHNGTDWQIRQQGTYAPDEHSRWMAGIAMNANHEIGLAYSISSGTVYPGIRYAGQSAAANAAANGLMDIAEVTIWDGNASQTSSERWGDYSNLAIDPVDEATFWYTTEYNISGSNKGTRIASFTLSVNNPVVADFSGSPLEIAVGETVSFTDLSTNNPDNWDWTFEGGNPAISDDQNPTVTYNAAGVYDVSLYASNANGGNTMTKTDYITVLDNYLDLSATSVSVDANAGSESFSILSNIDWTVSETCDWLSAAPTSGNGNAAITINYQENADLAERSCVLTVSGEGLTQEFTITQAGATAFLSINPDAESVGATASSTSFALTSNVDWIVSESCDWVSVSPASGSDNSTIIVTYDENTDLTERVCVIDIDGGGFSESFTLTQAGVNAYLNIDPIAETVGANASTTSFSLSSNVDWIVSESCDWVSVSPASGSDNSTITVTYDENTELTERVCIVTVDGGGFSESFTLTQAGVNAYLNIDPIAETVGANASTTSFSLTSNVDWEVSESCSWLSVSPITGNGDYNITINYDENTSIDSREYVINITGGGFLETFTLTQEGADAYLDLDIVSQDVDYPAGNFSVQLSSNTSWTVNESCDWLSVSPVSGDGNASLTISYNQNDLEDIRSCEIIVSAGNIDKTIMVTQDGFPVLIGELNNESIRVYPNPAHDYFMLETEANLDEILVIDAIGKTILKISHPSSKTKIDTQNWEKGLYIIKMTKGNIVVTENLQVQ